jgi:hypothetical protein
MNSQPEANFTYLQADGTNFIGSSAFRVDDGNLNIFIEAFPATGCQWPPSTVTDADIIIQEYHGHVTHYDAATVYAVQQNTGAIVVGNAQVASDMRARGVPSSKIVELSPGRGQNASETVLGVKITAYGMVHTQMTTVDVVTFMLELPNGIKFFHGTCSSPSSESSYMRSHTEFYGLDVMINDVDHNFGTLHNTYYPNALFKAHDYNNRPYATLWEDYPNNPATYSHNDTFRYVQPLPNVAPELTNGTASPLSATEDDSVTFKVFYKDVNNDEPEAMKVVLKEQASSEVERDLSPQSSPDPWTTGRWLQYVTKLTPGVWSFKFKAKDRVFWANTDWSPDVVNIRPRNKKPELSVPGFAPKEGDTETIFRFDIMYRDLDNQAPTKYQVFISGEGHDMTAESTGGPWNAWVTFYYESTLPEGTNHRFYFVFSDGEDEVRHPKVSDIPNVIPGPYVYLPNNPPILTGAKVSPPEGTRSTEFTFSIIYTDGEGDHPAVSQVHIDGVAYMMNAQSFDYISGATFTYRTRLTLGEHTVKFAFSDDENDVYYPVDGFMDGPMVTNQLPGAVIANPSDGERFVPDEPISLSAQGSSDPDDDTITYLWTSDIDGDLGDEEAIVARLKEGFHNITLTVEDGFGGSHSTSIQLEVRPYLPRPFVKEVKVDRTDPIETDPVKVTVVVGNDGEARVEGLRVAILVDGVEVYSDTVSVNVGATKEVSYTWTSEKGVHDIMAEIEGDSRTVTYSVVANTSPAASPGLVSEGEKFKPNEELYFEANASDAEGDELTYVWDWGDGTVNGTRKSESHFYAQEGTYTITVTITDARGGVTTDTIQVVIEKPKKDESPGFGAMVAGAAMTISLLVILTSRRRR